MRFAFQNSRLFHPLLIGGWILAATSVWAWAAVYEFSAEPVAEQAVDAVWPADSRLVRSSDRSTIVVFLHPRCPCSRATLRELEKLLLSHRISEAQQPDVVVVSTIPEGAGDEWTATQITHSASRLKRSLMFLDRCGEEANRFGAIVSGTVMLFDTHGRRKFVGGVTASRGHDGDNQGSRWLTELLTGRENLTPTPLPVFGCRLCLPRPTLNEVRK